MNYKGSTNTPEKADARLAEELNSFFSRFEVKTPATDSLPPPAANHHTIILQEHEVRHVLRSVNSRKAAGPDGIPSKVLQACADQLTEVFTKIFNTSLLQTTIPSCLKSATIIPIPKKQVSVDLNNFRPVALTRVILNTYLSSTTTLSTGAPQGCMDEIHRLTAWCSANNLSLNTTKTKEIIIDFRRKHITDLAPLCIGGACVERVPTFKFLGVLISDDLSWSANTMVTVQKAQQRLHFLRVLKRNNLERKLLVAFYRAAIESVLTYNISVWYAGCSAADKKALQR